MTDGTVCKITIPHTNRDCFDYLGGNVKPVPGARVLVPFKKQTRLGVVVGEGAAEHNNITLKSITELIDSEALITPPIMALCHWISSYYQSPLSEVIPLALPKKLREGHAAVLPPTDYYQLNIPLDQAKALVGKRAVKLQALLEFLGSRTEAVTKKTLTEAGFNKSQLDALINLQAINLIQLITWPRCNGQNNSKPLLLNEEQNEAVTTINSQLNSYHCFLLQGITGSGKTEVYLQVIAEVLAQNRQVLILVPEIGLTPQLLQRFSSRFDLPMAVIHSGLNESERAHAWLAAKQNLVKLVIGTRAAIFTPLPSLGLIVIDEEHDASLKQMDGVRYYARDCALMRAWQANIPVILGTATPSLESLHNCNLQKYTRIRLTQKALNSTPLQYQLLDLRNHGLQEGLAMPTLKTIREHLNHGNQVLVFINRRGFAPVLICHACGFMADCRACDSHLTMHRQSRRLICHHCGLAQAIPSVCKQCQGRELIPVGTGTQRIFEYLKQEFPDINVLRIDRDEVQKKESLNHYLESIHKGEVQLIVGTQMLAKGHHFPKLTLVVVVDADNGFYNQDFRAIEQLGQLLTQVAGRAGRAERPGQVLIQTHLPHHPLLNILIQQGYDAFSKELLQAREEAALPPYYFLAMIRAQDRQNSKIVSTLQTMKQFLRTFSIEVLGPAPAPLARKANQYRMQLLLKSASRKQLQSALTALRTWIDNNKQAPGVRWNIDVDPQDLA